MRKNPGNQGAPRKTVSPPPGNQAITTETPFALTWLRELGIFGALLTGIAIMPFYYWSGVSLFYLACALALLDLAIEPKFRSLRKQQAMFVIFILIIALGFTLGFVVVDVPLHVSSLGVNTEYADGIKVSGIAWRPEFSELDISIDNSTSHNYEDLNIVFRPDIAVAAIAQATNLSGVRFEDRYSALLKQELKYADGNMKANPIELVATDSGYRLRVDRLPPNTILRLVMACVDIKWNPNPAGPKPDFGVHDPDYLLKVKDDNFGTYWFGHQERTSIRHDQKYVGFKGGW